MGSKAKLQIEYLELMTGFYIVVGNVSIKSRVPRIKLIVNKQFQNEKYIISPELGNLLEGKITGTEEVNLDCKNSMFFILVRTNLLSKYVRKKDIKMTRFFDQYYINSQDADLEEIEKKKEEFYQQMCTNLTFEHYFFGSLFKTTLPTIRRPDLDIL